jgi:hypothetical protein
MLRCIRRFRSQREEQEFVDGFMESPVLPQHFENSQEKVNQDVSRKTVVRKEFV